MMADRKKENSAKAQDSSLYKSGLSHEREAVISAHFMHKMNQNHALKLYNDKEFKQKTLLISMKSVEEQLLPILLNASQQFVSKRVAAAKARAGKNFREYGLTSAADIGACEIITEVMFDRQFLKGDKSNYSREVLLAQVKTAFQRQEPIKMVIPALPYKSSSPLKCRGARPDLSELNFLLGLAEIAQTIERIYKEYRASAKTLAFFTVVCDGARFNDFLNEPDEIIRSYQAQLGEWINRLKIASYVRIVDYQTLISQALPPDLKLEKGKIREEVRQLYSRLMEPVLDPYRMHQSMAQAVSLDPDPERWHVQGRFIPLFKSLIYTMSYSSLLQYAKKDSRKYMLLYTEITRHLFEPYTPLTADNRVKIKAFIADPEQHEKPEKIQLFEYLRQSMLKEAWDAAIHYLAEIRSDRDLKKEPVIACLPGHIRWTIHAKAGQLAVLTTTAFGDPVQPWHGTAVFKLTKDKKIKLYTLPVLLLEGHGAVPAVIDDAAFPQRQQPFFYIYPGIEFKDMGDFFHQLQAGLTRNRKL